MKVFEVPEIEITEFKVLDVITTSDGVNCKGELDIG